MRQGIRKDVGIPRSLMKRNPKQSDCSPFVNIRQHFCEYTNGSTKLDIVDEFNLADAKLCSLRNSLKIAIDTMVKGCRETIRG